MMKYLPAPLPRPDITLILLLRHIMTKKPIDSEPLVKTGRGDFEQSFEFEAVTGAAWFAAAIVAGIFAAGFIVGAWLC